MSEIQDHSDPKDVRNSRSLKFSLLDGIFASGMTGFTQEYFTPFLLLIGGSGQQVGIMNALQNFSASLSQLKSPDLTAFVKSRRKIINTFVFLQALMLLPMTGMALSRSDRPFVFIGCVILFAIFGSLFLPAWSSLISDIVPRQTRGVYFGWRNKILGLVTVSAALLAGFVLNWAGRWNPFSGFVVIFSVAFVFRMFSGFFLTRMHEPFISHGREHQFTIIQFFARLKESNFAKFVIFVALMNFSVNVASPFFGVLMLRDLSFGYFLYSVVTTSATLTVCLMMGRWGRLADRVGNLKIIRLTAFLIGLIPLLWLLNRHPLFLIFAQVFSGFAWAGFNLCASNYIFDAVTPEKRTRCVAYFTGFNSLALCLGSLAGAYLLPKLPLLSGYNILTLMLISSVLRIVVALAAPRKLKEVRGVEAISYPRLLMSVLGFSRLGRRRQGA